MKMLLEGARQYKGNLHMHTTNSDGGLSPDDAVQAYINAGYDFVALTDHWKSVPERYVGDFYVMSGVEIDYLDVTQALHIVGLGVDPDKLVTDRASVRVRPVQEGIDMLLAAGGRAVLAHPAWSLNTLERIAPLQGLSAAEIYNTMSGPPFNTERADSSSLLDMYSANGKRFPLVAVDDAHHYQCEHCKSYTMIQARTLTREGILEALDAGRFYASQGPIIHQIEITPTALTIHCEPVVRALYFSNLPWVRDRCVTGEALTELRYERNPRATETFIRCELTDARGNRAWTSPLTWPDA